MTGLRVQGDLWVKSAPLVRGLTMDLPAGAWSVLIGASGTGKSSLARLIAGLPVAATLDGTITAGDSAPLGGRVAMLGQEDSLLPWADLVANVTLPARLAGQRPDTARARRMLADVGLDGLGHRRPSELSGGQRQRVALARVLMGDAPVVVLDEPFSALDTLTRLAMQDLAARLLRGRTVLLITHDPFEAMRLAHFLWRLTPEGAEPLALPPGPAPRDPRAPQVLAAQATLIGRLQAA